VKSLNMDLDYINWVGKSKKREETKEIKDIKEPKKLKEDTRVKEINQL